MVKFLFAPMALISGLMACAQNPPARTVTFQVREEKVYVTPGKGELKTGDKVAIFHQECPSNPKGGSGFCKKIQVSQGEVTKVLNGGYVMIQLPPGVIVQEGEIVEKLP